MAYPEEYYINARVGAERLTRDQEFRNLRKERQAFKWQYGCGGCWFRGEQVFDQWTCKLEKTPHGGGYCATWFDCRSEKTPEQVGWRTDESA